ncbi:MAG: hypothetical protein HC792_01750 [Acaryochloridaceae cyanobacterium CSU_5_19]|nr:hypothetical protein [Acaryochloridaceae cyanobacterium CSU_5_19]
MQPRLKSKIAQVGQRNWQPIDASKPEQGEYHLIDYTYPTPGSPSQGTLRVQGRVNASQPSESVAELEVKFLVNAPPPQVPGLWVQSASTVGDINADVLSPCNTSITATPRGNFQVRELNLPTPPLPAPPSAPTGVISLGSLASGGVLPRPGDSPNASGVYQYKISNLNQGFTVDNSSGIPKQIEIWVNDTINLAGKTLIHSCGAMPNCGPFQVKIYGLGIASTDITLDQGTVICDVFIYAPGYTVTNTAGGTSSATECGAAGSGTKNTGVFWVNSWNNTGSVRIPVLDPPRGSWTQAPSFVSYGSIFLLQPQETWGSWTQAPMYVPYPPTLGPIQTWATQEKTIN